MLSLPVPAHMPIYSHKHTLLSMATSASSGRALFAETDNKTLASLSVFFLIMPQHYVCTGLPSLQGVSAAASGTLLFGRHDGWGTQGRQRRFRARRGLGRT